MELTNDFSPVEVNEISADRDIRCNEYEVNEVSHEVRNGEIITENQITSNNNRNFSRKTHQNTRTQDSKSGKKWEQKEKDSKITLTQESSHFMPTKFSDSFFKQFDLVMKLRREELKKQGIAQTEVSEISEGDLVEAFGITKNQMVRAAEILAKDENTEKLGDSSF